MYSHVFSVSNQLSGLLFCSYFLLGRICINFPKGKLMDCCRSLFHMPNVVAQLTPIKH